MELEAKEEFGRYIKKMREDARLSLREAEAIIGISNSYLYQIERGERNPPKLEVLRKMAGAYGISLSALMAAAHIQEPEEHEQFYNEDELERAFEFVRKDKRFRFGTHMSGNSLTPEAKRFIVEMYQKLSDRKLISDQVKERNDGAK